MNGRQRQIEIQRQRQRHLCNVRRPSLAGSAAHSSPPPTAQAWLALFKVIFHFLLERICSGQLSLCELKIFVVCWHLNEIIPRRSKLTAILLPSSPPSVLGSKPMWASAVVPLVPLSEASPSVSARSRWESAERVGSKGDPGAQTCTRSSSQSLVTSCNKYLIKE